jgi:D-alanyl-D-alanine carboxypeptidase (penicillin-binding protein 5/6)
MGQPPVVSYQSSAKRIFFVIIFFLFVINFSLFTAHAGEISAKAAAVIDSSTEKILYAKNPNLKLPPASTAKLMTAIVALDRINPEAIVTISERATNVPSVTPRLKAGERYTVKDLLYLALMRSVNSAAIALAEAVAGSEDAFVKMMNEKAFSLGAENTRFINSSGLPGPDQYITAFDLAKIMKESLKYPLIKEIIYTRTHRISTTDRRCIFVKNTNLLLWKDEELLGGKTGYTKTAKHCFVCAAAKGQHTFIAAVLGESIRENLWQDTSVLISKANDIVSKGAEPMIYFSHVKENSEPPASYNERKTTKKYKKAGYKKIGRSKKPLKKNLSAYKKEFSKKS